MPKDKPHLTKSTIDKLAPGEKHYILFDERLPGFGVRVAPSGRKTFIVEYRPHGGGRAVAKRRLTLGPYGPLTPDLARKRAVDALAEVRLGHDPQEEKNARRAALTVSDLINAFMAEHVVTKCKAKTAEAHKIALERLRSTHGNLKAEALTRAQVAALHVKMSGSPFAANRFLAVVSKCFAWGMSRGLIPEGHSPAAKVERYKEAARERFLTNEELARLGDTLRMAETTGLPWQVDATKLNAKHLPKPENRKPVPMDLYAVAAAADK
jgi:hypothetical protein